MSTKKITIKISDMTCTSCESRIKSALQRIDGVLDVKVSYQSSLAEVQYDDTLCNINSIKDTIKRTGYSTESLSDINKVVGIITIAVAIFMLAKLSTSYKMIEQLDNASYFMLIVVGLISSLHCVGMCGGIMLSQSITKDTNSGQIATIKPALLYNSGRVVSYTLLGALIGSLGSVLSLTLEIKAAIQIAAGVFMIIMGLNMTGLNWFRKIHIRLPWSACHFKQKSKAPFVVGLLNGFMPCGPLQTMQIFALGTGSALKGAASMFFFSIGTVPLMLTFGALSAFLSNGHTKKLLKLSGVLVMSLGIIMSTRGLALKGIRIPSPTSIANLLSGKSDRNIAKDYNLSNTSVGSNLQTIKMTASGSGYNPNALVVQRDIPVKFIVTGEELTACNSTLIIPSLQIEKSLKSGENIIEFTPTSTKDINFSCSMGMLKGVIKVVDNLKTADTASIAKAVPPPGTPSYESSQESRPTRAPSIYGGNLQQVPINLLMKKAYMLDNYQQVSILGRSYEFSPLIVLVNKEIKTKIKIDLNGFDNPEGTYNVVNASNGKVVYSFEGKKGIVELEMEPSKVAAFGICKNGELLEIIQVVDDINNVDLMKIKERYIR